MYSYTIGSQPLDSDTNYPNQTIIFADQIRQTTPLLSCDLQIINGNVTLLGTNKQEFNSVKELLELSPPRTWTLQSKASLHCYKTVQSLHDSLVVQVPSHRDSEPILIDFNGNLYPITKVLVQKNKPITLIIETAAPSPAP